MCYSSVFLLTLCSHGLHVIAESFLEPNRSSTSAYRKLESPLYSKFTNFTVPSVNVSIVNLCTGSECRAVCGGEPWGTRVARAICKEFVESGRVLVSASNFTLPGNLTERRGRARMECQFEGSAVACDFFGISNCPSGHVAAVHCQSEKATPEIVTSGDHEPSYCPSNPTVDGKGVFQWPRTPSGIMRYISCTGPDQPVATRLCNRSGGWEEADTLQCSFESKSTEQLHNLSKTVVTESNVDQIVTDSLTIVKEIPKLAVPDIHLAVSIYDNVQQSGMHYSSQVYTSLTDMTGIILSSDPETLYRSELLTRSSSRAVANIELTALDYNLPLNRSSHSPLIEVQNILIDGIDLPGTFKGVTFSESRDNHYERTDTDQFPMSIGKTRLGISLPQTLVDSLSVNETNLRIQFVVYNRSSFFQEQKYDNYTIPSPNVLSSSVGSQTITQLPDSVVIRFDQFLWNDSFFPQCVFWNNSLNDGHGGWSDSGCVLIETTDKSITCSCNHLTSFSALMTLCTRENEESNGCPCKEQNEAVLSLISLTGCTISAFALVLTIIALIMLIRRKKRRGMYSPALLQLNLCLALLLGLLFFILATQTTGQDGNWCIASAALLQYFISSTVLLMMFEAIAMYRDIVLVFHSGKPFIKSALIISWGVPAVLVAVLAILDSNGIINVYGLITIFRYDTSPGIADNKYCWLQNTIVMLSAFAGPVIFIELFNLFVSVRIYFALKARADIAVDRSVDFKRRIRSMLAVASLLGLTLLFGAVTLIDSSPIEKQAQLCDLILAFHYIFAIFNSALGLFVFVFTVLLSSDQRQLIVEIFCKGKKKREDVKELISKKGQRPTLGTEMSTLSGRTLTPSPSDTSVFDNGKQPEFEIPEELQEREAQTASLY